MKHHGCWPLFDFIITIFTIGVFSWLFLKTLPESSFCLPPFCSLLAELCVLFLFFLPLCSEHGTFPHTYAPPMFVQTFHWEDQPAEMCPDLFLCCFVFKDEILLLLQKKQKLDSSHSNFVLPFSLALYFHKCIPTLSNIFNFILVINAALFLLF